MKTFYDVLNISRNATRQEIIIAYRKRCIETHPDKGGNEIDFLNVKKRYDILSNPEKRAAYDRYIYQKEKEQLEKQIQDLKNEKDINRKDANNKERSFFNIFLFTISFLILAIVAYHIIYSEDKIGKENPTRIETNSNDSPKYTYRDRTQDENKDKDIKWIYNELSKNTNIGSYNEFIEALKDPDMAKYYYNETKLYNIGVGSLDDFNKQIIREGIIDKKSPEKDSKDHNNAT